MPVACAVCGRIFKYPCHLLAHQARKTSCAAEAPKHYMCANCGGRFTAKRGLGRHQRERCRADEPGAGGAEPEPEPEPELEPEPESALASEPGAGGPSPPAGATIVHHHHYGQTTTFRFGRDTVIAGAGSSLAIDSVVALGARAAAPPRPGEAGGRKAPRGGVLPISSPVELGIQALRDAIDLLPGTVAAECAAMRPGAASRLFFELMAGLHRGRAEHRSLRPCRARADLVEVRTADARWVATSLTRGLGLAFDQIADGIEGEIGGDSSDRLTAGGARRSYEANPAAVVAAASPDEVNAHLQDMAALGAPTEEPDECLLPHARDTRNPRSFGHPGYAQVDLDALGSACMRIAARQIGSDGAIAPREACRAILGEATRAVYCSPRNASIFALPKGGFVAWTAHGWRPQSEAAVTEEVFDQCVLALELALRQVATPPGCGGLMHLVGGGESALVRAEGAGALKDAASGAEPNPVGPDPELARVHPRPWGAPLGIAPTRLRPEAMEAITGAAGSTDLASATGEARHRACVLAASAGELLTKADWAGLPVLACEAAMAAAQQGAAPCHKALHKFGVTILYQ